MGFNNYHLATQMRDVIRKLVKDEVVRMRPEPRYATVETIDRSQRTCTVVYEGESVAVPVAMGSVQPQSAGQIVRIEGIKGDRFISDVMGPAYFDGILAP